MRVGATTTVLGATALAAGFALAAAGSSERPPERLADTGLFEPGSVEAVRSGLQSFTPQYPLWSDGATKRRWIELPSGAAIDASRPAAWVFPAGTRFWKEFSVDGRRIETRMIERLLTGNWRFSAYVWNDAQTEATLVPVAGIRALPLPDGGRYTIPSEPDCRACHEGAASPVLGFSALQLSSDRDPLAPHAEPGNAGDVELRKLVATGRLINLPRELLDAPPRIQAPTLAGRAALGYLNANCGQCHADPKLMGAAVPVDLQLALGPADAGAAESIIRTLVESESRYRPAGAADARLLVPGDASAGTLLARMRSRDPRIQMPPLGSAKPDLEAIALIEHWIEQDLKENREKQP
jgi:hypothetical protein